jgi:deoxyribonuclease-1
MATQRSSRFAFLAMILGCAYLFSPFVSAVEKDPKKVLKKDFWGKVHASGGESFYTRKPFKKKTPLLTESYIYPTISVRDHLQCGTNRQCSRENEDYRAILSDLHNIVVADSNLAFKLKSATFGILDESVEKDEFGMRIYLSLVEPSDDRKGDVARTIFYMHKTYDLPIPGQAIDYILWNEQDPPSEEEKARNDLIESIQGSRNIFIDDPSLIKRPETSASAQ